MGEFKIYWLEGLVKYWFCIEWINVFCFEFFKLFKLGLEVKKRDIYRFVFLNNNNNKFVVISRFWVVLD